MTDHSYTPSRSEVQKRQVAVEATDTIWIGKLRDFVEALEESRACDVAEANEFALERASVKEDIIADLLALMAEREHP